MRAVARAASPVIGRVAISDVEPKPAVVRQDAAGIARPIADQTIVLTIKCSERDAVALLEQCMLGIIMRTLAEVRRRGAVLLALCSKPRSGATRPAGSLFVIYARFWVAISSEIAVRNLTLRIAAFGY